jgi:hypothetical protein
LGHPLGRAVIDAWHAVAIDRGQGVHVHHTTEHNLHPSSGRLGVARAQVTRTLTTHAPWDALDKLRTNGAPIGLEAISYHGPGEGEYEAGDVPGVVVVTVTRSAWRGTFIDPAGHPHRIQVWTDSLPFDMTRLLIAGTN